MRKAYQPPRQCLIEGIGPFMTTTIVVSPDPSTDVDPINPRDPADSFVNERDQWEFYTNENQPSYSLW